MTVLTVGQRYDAKVSKTMHSQDRSGYAMLKVQVCINDIEGEVLLWGNISISPKAAGMARKQLQAIGFDPDAQEFEEIGGKVSLVGNAVKNGVEVGEFNGSMNVKCFGLLGGASPQAMKKATDMLRAAKKGGSAAPNAPANNPPPPPADFDDSEPAEDIPF